MGVHDSTDVCALCIRDRAYWLSQGTVEENPKARSHLTRKDLREQGLVLAYSLRRDPSWKGRYGANSLRHTA